MFAKWIASHAPGRNNVAAPQRSVLRTVHAPLAILETLAAKNQNATMFRQSQRRSNVVRLISGRNDSSAASGGG
jgi:hypothetical protein